MNIKSLSLATGDFYENIIYLGNEKEFFKKIKKREFIKVTENKTDIIINSDFIVSIVMR